MAYTGIDGLRAYKVMASLVRSLYFLADVTITCAKETQTKPEDMSFDIFSGWFDGLDEKRKRTLFKLSVVYGIVLEQDELLSLLKYRKDNNNIAISKSNIGNLTPKQITEIISDVCVELAEEKIFF